jgi:hypothetical protein
MARLLYEERIDDLEKGLLARRLAGFYVEELGLFTIKHLVLFLVDASHQLTVYFKSGPLLFPINPPPLAGPGRTTLSKDFLG